MLSRYRRLRTTTRRKKASKGRIAADSVVWIFGSGRTGSSWLAFMLGSLPDHFRWNEPLVGYLFGHLYERDEHRRATATFILAQEHRAVWMSSIRALVLDGATARFPDSIGRGFVVIKEPHGSIGAPLLMEALPESRMIFLVRDPRDVVASAMQLSFVPTRWKSQPNLRAERAELVREAPDGFAAARARTYRQDIERTSQAFDDHTGYKTLVRYEDLRRDTLTTMQGICSNLGIQVDHHELSRVVRERAWENIPEDQKGPGKMRRKATPGAWREDLTPTQVAIVESETSEILSRFYGA